MVASVPDKVLLVDDSECLPPTANGTCRKSRRSWPDCLRELSQHAARQRPRWVEGSDRPSICSLERQRRCRLPCCAEHGDRAAHCATFVRPHTREVGNSEEIRERADVGRAASANVRADDSRELADASWAGRQRGHWQYHIAPTFASPPRSRTHFAQSTRQSAKTAALPRDGHAGRAPVRVIARAPGSRGRGPRGP